MSTLVDHYLLQLRTFLPAKQRDDIAAELRESIMSAVEERERELGRALSDDELNEVLRGFGHPMVVAGRYLPMQQLIGPDVFPLYWYSMQAVLIVIAVVGGLLLGIALLTAPNAIQAGLQVAFNFWWFALQAAAVVTFVFATLDYCKARFSFLEKFDARGVNAGVLGLRGAPLSAIPRSDTVFEMATTAILLLWWVEWLVFPSTWRGVELRLSSAIEPFFYGARACASSSSFASASISCARRTVPRVLLRLALNVAWLTLIMLAYRTRASSKSARTSARESAAILRMAQISMSIALFGMGIVTAILAARMSSPVPPLTRRAQPRSCWIFAMPSASFGRAVMGQGRSASTASQIPRPGKSA
jgi:hypothetical protein